MDIAALSITLHQGQLMQSLNMAVMKLAMETAVQQSESLQQVLAVAEKAVYHMWYLS